MATPSTACYDMVTALLSILSTYNAAHPNLLRAIFTSRPGGVAEVPFAFIGGRDEVIVHTSGTRTRNFQPTVVLVDSYGDNQQTMDRLDVLQDGLVDAFTAGVHALAGAVIEQTSIRDGDIKWEGTQQVTWYRARTFHFNSILIQEGRV